MMTINDCKFYKNEGIKGGVIFASDITANIYKSSLIITDSTFHNSSTT